MKKLFVLAVLTLIASLAFSEPMPAGSVVLGERTVDFHADHDVIQVGTYDGWFKNIGFWVERNNIEVFNVVVTYGDGEREKIDTRLIFNEGTRSRMIQLARKERMIKNIAFTFKTVGRWFEGRARVVVFGVR